ncbi:MAG TPA: AraC family transcriptional regulator [Gemmatimonadaceae bacterium]
MNVPGASVTLATFPGLLRLGAHAHERPCLTVLLTGVMAERIRGRERYCERASVLIKPGLERHDDLFGAEGSAQIIIEPVDLEGAMFKSYQSLFATERFFRDGNAERLASRLASELETPDSFSDLATASLTFELIVALARRGRRVREVGQPPPSWLRRTHALLAECHGAIPTIAALAREAAVHPAHLARAFRAHYGCSIGTFVRRRRVEMAARDLCVPGASIAGVAVAHGFTDQSHLTRQFRRFLGLTPREFQHRARSR